MENIQEINLEKRIRSNLTMRYSAKDLFDELNINASKIIMNFENVEFMSRAFAQEYVYQKEHSDINIVEKNMSKFIKDMFDLVNNSHNE